MSAHTRAQLQIHVCVVLWGFTAILGKLITLPALPLVWWRMVLVTAILALLPRVWRGIRAMSRRLILGYAGAGVVVSLHWLTFYGSIKLSNASVGALCMGFAPVFLALVEPVIARRPFDPRELLLGVAVVPGVVLAVGGAPVGMHAGLAMGTVSAFLVSIFGALNKRLVDQGDPLAVTAIELGTGALLVTLLAPVLPHEGRAFVVPGLRDAGMLVVLAVGCTLLPFTLSLVALRQLSAFGAQLAVNLEPVYAMIIAAVLMGEHRELGGWFYLGVVMILGTVLAYPWLRMRRTGGGELRNRSREYEQ